MPGNTASNEAGLRYQELYGWYRVLDLKSPSGKVRSVSIEDPAAGFFDDVVVRPVPGTAHAPEYLQVKFHVDVSDVYSSDSLLSETHGFLLRKAWSTWQKLKDEARLELHLITTWAWDPKDPLATEIRDGRLTDRFVNGTVGERPGDVREKWRVYLGGPSEDDFRAFLGSFRFHPGYPATTDLLRLVQEKMQARGLKDDEAAAWRGARAVREWMIARRTEITEPDVDEAIERLDLRDKTEEPSVLLWLHTVAKPAETGADYELDWRELFEGPEHEKGHRLQHADDWNGRLLPDLRAMAARIGRETTARLLRVRGFSRLSVWFALGFVFRQTTGWVIETDQYGKLWRTDARASGIRVVTREQRRPGPASVAALAVSITGDASAAVARHLANAGEPAGRLIHVGVEQPGRDAVSGAADLTAIADAARGSVLALDERPSEVELFYWGPASGAVFIGHALNGVAPTVQLFEEEFGAYHPSITLT